jgi:hypothetical protein
MSFASAWSTEDGGNDVCKYALAGDTATPCRGRRSLPDADRPEPREPFANTMRICRAFRVRVNLNPEHALPQDTQRHGARDLLQCTKDEEMVRGVQQHSGD